MLEHYPQYDLESVFELDDLQFAFLVRGLDANFRLNRANTLPGMIDDKGMKATVAAAPHIMTDSSKTFEWLQEQCEAKGLIGPVR